MAISHKRKHPRCDLKKKVGVLFGGQYFTCYSRNLSEGGIGIETDLVLTMDRDVIISFQIPGGAFVSVRGKIRNVVPKGDTVFHGFSFENINFTHKRQIRNFVSSRLEYKELN